MKITFISNYMTHHQLPFCEEMYKRLGDEFVFLATDKMESERTNMGWGIDISKYPFIKQYEDNIHEKLILDSDVVLSGGSHVIYINNRLNQGKITFRYFERLYKTGQMKAFIPTSYMRKRKEHTSRKDSPIYLLCAGAFVASDFSLIGAYKNKRFKWGYFPSMSLCSFEEIMAKKTDVKDLLWTGRMLDWKHPLLAVKAIEILSKKGIDIHLTMIGEGDERTKLDSYIESHDLQNIITIKPFMNPEEVREEMVKRAVYLMTSDGNEGWGAVVNEAMDSGMAVIGSASAGSVPYLIEDGKNGFIFKSGDEQELAKLILRLVDNDELRETIAKNAYGTIHNMWNASLAAERYIDFCKGIMEGSIPEYSDGPLSEAECVSPAKAYSFYKNDR